MNDFIIQSLVLSTLVYGYFESMLPVYVWEFFKKTEWKSERDDFSTYLEDFKIKGFPLGTILSCKICFSTQLSLILGIFITQSFWQSLACPIIALGVHKCLTKD